MPHPHGNGRGLGARVCRPRFEEQPVVRPHDEVARIAYSYWESRGRQDGSPEEDWYRAEREWDRMNSRT